jgi:2-phospho-L-lactate guanylyltransferase
VKSGIVAVIPIRSFSEGKSRLASVLPAADRERLIRLMFAHVVMTVRQSGVIDRICVISPDPAVLAAARAIDASILAVQQPFDRPGLDAAVTMGRGVAIEEQAGGMLVLFGDLPVLQPEDVRSLVRRDAPVVIATDRHGAGTNALMLRLGSSTAEQFNFSYGPNSHQRHLEEADRLGLDAVTAISAGTAFDLDTVDDIERLRAHGRAMPEWLANLTDLVEEKSA